jgi:signal transduction histidine kinase
VGGAAERKGSLLMACADAASVAIENARLIRALQSKNDALAIMAHELRTPIGAIIGFVSEVMAGETESREEDLELMGLVKSEAERVAHMVNQVLGMARTDASALEWSRELVDPLELVLASTDTLRPLARQAEVTITRDADEDVPEFLGDRDRMIQVLVNLVGNAIKFAPPGGVIHVQATAADGGVSIAVLDEGPGVPEDRLDAIFEAYEQAGPEGQREKGVGLGLAVSQEIVRRHGGRIGVENRVGGGACFTLWLPGADADRSAG